MQSVNERVMDSMDLEREKGITILAKNTAIHYGDVKINIVDTPGHADFGGEVERALTMVDGVLLLVDASEGPLPQTRFVLRKALEHRSCRSSWWSTRSTVPTPASARLSTRSTAFSSTSTPPSSRSSSRSSTPTPSRAGRRSSRAQLGTDLKPLFELIVDRIPAPTFDPEHPLQAWVTNLDASQYVGRLALCRIFNGTIKRGQTVAWCRADGTIERAKISELYVTEALDRVAADEAGPGEIIAVAGIREINIGETLADADDPRPLPVITVDEPSLSMTIGTNYFAPHGREGTKLTARLVKTRLDAELIGNVSLRILPDRSPRHLGSASARRVAARRARRDHAPRRLRAHRRQARGRHPR